MSNHKCADHSYLYCEKCIFERECEYKKLYDFVKHISELIGSCNCLDKLEIEDAKKLLEEIGES